MSEESLVSKTTDYYLRLLRSLSNIQSMAVRLGNVNSDIDFRPNTLFDPGRVILNEVTSAVSSARELHLMLEALILSAELEIGDNKKSPNPVGLAKFDPYGRGHH